MGYIEAKISNNILFDISMTFLKKAYNPKLLLFDRQLRNKKCGKTLGTEAITSTAICLIGLDRAAISPSVIGLSPGDSIVAATNFSIKMNYLGSLGLLVWVNSLYDALSLKHLMTSFDVSLRNLDRVLNKFNTMEVAWLLSGLCHEYRRRPNQSTMDVLLSVLQILLGRYNSRTKLFYHSDSKASLTVRIRKNIANFADQIYPIQALSFANILCEKQAALKPAVECAKKIIRLQGPLGQWWWHYNVCSGSVFQAYPVFSVHQYGMAPMALLVLGRAAGFDAGNAIDLGYQWLEMNESGRSLIDVGDKTIWRDIEHNHSKLERANITIKLLASSFHKGILLLNPSHKKLIVNYETRPYELGWLLYSKSIGNKNHRSLHLF